MPLWFLGSRLDRMTTRELRTLSGYHLGTDLATRLADAERSQSQQRQALEWAADRIEELEQQLATLQANCKSEPAAV